MTLIPVRVSWDADGSKIPGSEEVLGVYGFRERIKGDHYVYKHDDIIERIVIQPSGNKAKAYQVKQVRNLFIKYGL